MSQLLSYLAAQVRRQPGPTVRFVAGELWRRGRARLHPALADGLPEFGTEQFRSFTPLFVPSTAAARERAARSPWIAAAVARAERIRRGEVEILGEWVDFGLEPDWHRDWQSGHRWPLQPAGRLRVMDAPPGADVKRPWELARFHHGLDLAAASALTGDSRFAATFNALVGHWVENNPWPHGIHWAMPMEVALRSMNWIQAAMLASAAGLLDETFARELSRSLFLHGRHLWAYREWNPVARANHYLACVAGLVWLGLLFETTPEGRQWLDFGRRELLSEMESQVGADGVVREGSSCYHAFVTELFLSAALLLARRAARAGGTERSQSTNGRLAAAIEGATSLAFAARLPLLFEFLSALSAGRHLPPIWGDADDGRALPFGGTSLSPVRALSAIGDALAGHPQPSGCPAVDAEIFWRLGFVPEPEAPRHPSPAHTSQAFPEGGFYFFSGSRMRGSIRCGPLGVNGWANHAHNDQLSFEFALDGRAIVVDPGLPCYSADPAARNLFRSTRYHNTVEIAGAEQNRFWPELLFRIVDDTHSRTNEWRTGGSGAVFSGSHSGYSRLPERALVRRGLRIAPDDTLAVRDTLELASQAPVAWYFHFAPDIFPQPAQMNPATSFAAGMTLHSCWCLGPALLAVCTAFPPEQLEAKTGIGWIAPRFGQKLPAPILEFRGRFAGRVEIQFVFTPALSAPVDFTNGQRT